MNKKTLEKGIYPPRPNVKKYDISLLELNDCFVCRIVKEVKNIKMNPLYKKWCYRSFFDFGVIAISDSTFIKRFSLKWYILVFKILFHEFIKFNFFKRIKLGYIYSVKK